MGGSNVPKIESMFIGEVPASEFITGDALASAIGLTAGIPKHSDAGWLHFVDSVDGKTKYVAKRSFRYRLSWSHINDVGAVLGNKTITVGSDLFKVRLMQGFSSNPTSISMDNKIVPDANGTHGSEWNRLMYRIVDTPTGVSGEGILFGEWFKYPESEIDVNITYGNGAASWTQETAGYQNSRRGVRGIYGVTSSFQSIHNNAGDDNYSWRPVLELVE